MYLITSTDESQAHQGMNSNVFMTNRRKELLLKGPFLYMEMNGRIELVISLKIH